MGIIDTLTKGVRTRTGTAKDLRGEDKFRRLAPEDDKAYRMPVRFSTDHLVLTGDSAWTGTFVPPKPWGFLDREARMRSFHSAVNVMERVFPNSKESGGQILTTNQVYTADQWVEALIARTRLEVNPPLPAYKDYVVASKGELARREFWTSESYLFTRLGSRGGGDGFTGFMNSLLDMMFSAAGASDTQPSPDEIEYWTTQAEATAEVLGGSSLRAQGVPHRLLEWLVRHQETPGMPTPDVAPADDQMWGPGWWRTVMAAYTEVVDLGVVDRARYKGIKITAPTGHGHIYAAYLPIVHIPTQITYEHNWLHHAASLPFPVDSCVHFEIVDPDRAEKDLTRPISDADAQATEDAEAQVGVDDTLAQQTAILKEARRRVQMSREPLAYWQAVFCVYDADPDALRTKIATLIRHYKDIHFELTCPPNDQRELYYQGFPCAPVTVMDWLHRTQVSYLALAQPWLTTAVGDRDDHAALYQGYTIVRDAQGAPKKGVPVFFDLGNVETEEGQAPTEAVFADPGSGKTVSRGCKPALEDALAGRTQLIWDPKGDFKVLHAYARQLRLDPSKVRVIDLFDPRSSVSLDMFAIAEVDPVRDIDDRQSAALGVLNQLCAKQINDNRIGLRTGAMLTRVVSDALAAEKSGGERATMQQVRRRIHAIAEGDFDAVSRAPEGDEKGAWREAAGYVDDHLNTVEGNSAGRLLFRDPDNSGSLRITPGDLVIFVATQLRPSEPDVVQTIDNVISDVIYGVMTDYIRSFLANMDAAIQKVAVFDEWHVIARSPRSEALLDWMKRMGRSKRCQVRQLSQRPQDAAGSNVNSVWVGKIADKDDAEEACRVLGIEPTPAYVQMIQGLGKGQFVFRDAYGRVAVVQVDFWDQTILDLFNSSGTAKARAQAAAAA